jgi:hypothetical protein
MCSLSKMPIDKEAGERRGDREKKRRENGETYSPALEHQDNGSDCT